MINQAADLLRFVTAMQNQLEEDMEGLLDDVEKYDLLKSVEQGIKSVNSALKMFHYRILFPLFQQLYSNYGKKYMG